jgi:SAM-dependent methyltransferase
MSTPAGFFRSLGLEPLSWDDALRLAEATLGAEADTFARKHRAFVAYPTEHTARAFYDLVARHGLHPLLASHRFDRLVAIAEALDASSDASLNGARALDVGAGGGFLAAWLRDARGARVTVSDLSPASEEALAARGFALLRDTTRDASNDARFDLILCADSLGEVHADEDEWLSDAAHAEDPRFAAELEARYGFAEKLSALRPRLAAGGRVALFEPAPQAHFWRGAARLLEGHGWSARILGPEPAWGLILTLA